MLLLQQAQRNQLLAKLQVLLQPIVKLHQVLLAQLHHQQLQQPQRLQHRRLNKRPRHNHQLRLVKLKLNRAKLARPNQVKHKLANLLLRLQLKHLVQHQTIATMVLIVLLRLGLLVKNLVVHILLVTVNTSVSTN